jgi:hypothetical protein
MLALLLMALVTVGLAELLARPLVLLLTPVLDLSWLGWVLLLLVLWLFAGGRPPGSDAGGSTGGG